MAVYVTAVCRSVGRRNLNMQEFFTHHPAHFVKPVPGTVRFRPGSLGAELLRAGAPCGAARPPPPPPPPPLLPVTTVAAEKAEAAAATAELPPSFFMAGAGGDL